MLAPTLSFVVFMFVIAGLGAAVYLALFMSHVPGAKEERFGELEPLPARLGEWIPDEARASDGTLREQRHLFDESRRTLTLQVRYRGPSGDIVRVEPEQTVKRKRIRPS